MEVAVQLWVLFAGLGAVLAGLFLIFRQLTSQAQDKQDIAQLAATLQSANERLERELRNALYYLREVFPRTLEETDRHLRWAWENAVAGSSSDRARARVRRRIDGNSGNGCTG